MSQYDFLNQPLSGTSENSGENGTRNFGITDFGTIDFGTRDLGNRDFGTIDFGFSEEPYTFADHKKLVYGNAFKDLEERDRTVEEALSDEIESGEIDLADVDYEAREQIADYYKRSQEDQDGKEYLVRGALLRCSCGTNSRKLNLSPCHGVYFKEHPLVHKMDCKQGKEENITWYGVCDQVDLETEEIVVVNDRGQKQTGRKCCPEIIGSWRNTYSKAQIADNHAPSEEYELYDALTVDSYLICRHGGIITPVNSGQSREVLLEEFKNGQEAFDKIVKYDKENSVSDEMEAESEDNIESGKVGEVETQEVYLQYGAKGTTTNPEDGFFRLYTKPTLGNPTDKTMFDDLYEEYEVEPFGSLQSFGDRGSVLNRNKEGVNYGGQTLDPEKGTLVYNGMERYAVALGPLLQNPNCNIYNYSANDMEYGTCVDISVELDGKRYYIPAIITDVKHATAPTGIFQSGIDLDANNIVTKVAGGSMVEWYVVQKDEKGNKSSGLIGFDYGTSIIFYREDVLK